MTSNIIPIEQAKASPAKWAIRYAAIGWYVLPLWWIENGACACRNQKCTSPGKHPVGDVAIRGLHAASIDLQTITGWWAKHPKANIGIALAKSDLVAIDIDPRNGGEITFDEIEARHGNLSSSVEAFTGGGGRHLVFSLQESNFNLPGTLGPGIDLKRNGYIVVEPSIHLSGKSYEWEATSDPLDGAIPAPLPDWIRDMGRMVIVQPSGNTGMLAVDPGVVEDLKSALENIDPDDYHQWVNCGLALCELGRVGFDLWDAYSQRSAKYDTHKAARKWASFRPGPLHYESIFHWAQESGWINIPTPTAPDFIEAPPVVEKPPVFHPVEFPVSSDFFLPPGHLGAVASWINQTSVKPQPIFSPMAALALGSVVLGGRYVSSRGNWPSLYFLGIGKSGSGKEHPMRCVQTILEDSGHDELIGPSSYSSDSAVFMALARQPAHLAFIDELGSILQIAKEKRNFIGASMRTSIIQAFGRCGGRFYDKAVADRQGRNQTAGFVCNPALSILSMTTPSSLYSSLSLADVADGFINRFLIVETPIGRQPSASASYAPPPDSVLDWITRTFDIGPNLEGSMRTADGCKVPSNPRVLPFTASADRVIEQYDREFIELADSMERFGLADMAVRYLEIAMRLSLIVAVSCDQQCIDAEHVDWSARYVREHGIHMINQFQTHLTEGEHHAAVEEIFRVVNNRTPHGGVYAAHVRIYSRKLQNLEQKKITGILAELVECGRVAMEGKKFSVIAVL